MSEMTKTPAVAEGKPCAAIKIKRAVINLLKFCTVMALIVGMSIALSHLGAIHGKELPEEYFSNGYPTILKLLDSEVFMGFIFVVTIGAFGYVLYLLWQLHEVAVHKAQAMSSAHTQLVFALSLCGLFIDKTWWVLAIIIAFARWDILSDKLSFIINKGVKGDK
ncbi:magnesium transporter [Motilimonas pumila]|uniref:Magnesium transporter n=1 Tax=Motilimonas pumila TaxID=2303987 RepID=A0A418YCE9_9GAMM|nr:magnesium transporter [Motilimonas pumila]RJG42207.1 magnesium transporter [Motilimonas pumila]